MSPTRGLFAFLLLAAALAAQTAPDPSAPGPQRVTNGTYRFDAVQMPTIPYPVDIWATVWWPEGLPAGPYPLILFLHGNHGICRQAGTQTDVGTPLAPPQCPPGFEQTPNHLGYDYIAARLAGYGYIVASINANAINVRANGNPERGRLVQEHLRYWAMWNSADGGFPFNKNFTGKVDLRRVGLMGHSRGGEGMRAAYAFNQQEGAPFGIRALMEIGPVDFGRTTSATATTTGNPLYNADNVAWTVLLPACDGDVSDNQGMRVYDRARAMRERVSPAPKSQIYVLGANHNFYNSEWLPEDPGFQCIDFPIVTDRAQQEAIGIAYVMGFFRTYIGGEDFRAMFTGDRRPPAPVTVDTEPSYTESPENIHLVDDFSAPASPDVNTAGGVNTFNNVDLRSCSGVRCNQPPPASWVHDASTFAAKLAWPHQGAGTPSITMELASEGAPQNLSRFAMLAFRVAAQFDQRNPYLPESQDFSIRLIDSSGVASRALSVKSYRPVRYPTGVFFRRSVLKTVRIPLTDFTGIDRTRATKVQFLFDKTPTGALFLTDVHLTP